MFCGKQQSSFDGMSESHRRDRNSCDTTHEFIQLQFERVSMRLGYNVDILRESFYKKSEIIKYGLPLCSCSERDKNISEAAFVRLEDVIATLNFIGEVLPYKNNKYYVYNEKYEDELKKYNDLGPVFRVEFQNNNKSLNNRLLSGIWIGNRNSLNLSFLKLILL